MQIAIISGSHREKASLKVAFYLERTITEENPGVSAKVLSLANNPLPLWDESVWDNTPEWKAHWQPFQDVLRASDALIVVSPEWHGMVPAGLKNFFLLCTHEDVGHKPALIVSVSAGQGGAYPITELRTSGYKNSRICYIPEHIIVRHVDSQLNDGPAATSAEELLRERISHALKLLIKYGEALHLVREAGVFDFKKFPSGL